MGLNTTKYLSLKQAMQYMGITSYNTLYRMIENGLPVIEIGKAKRIDKDKLNLFMDEQTVIKKRILEEPKQCNQN